MQRNIERICILATIDTVISLKSRVYPCDPCDRVRVSSRNLFEGLSADQSARPTFSISGTTRIKPGTFPPFQLDRNTLCIPRNRISRKNIFRAFPLRMQMRTKRNTHVYSNRHNGEEIRGSTLNRNREEFQGLRRGRNARRILR